MNRMTAIDKGLVALWALNVVLACITGNWMAASACAGCVVLVLTRENHR